MTRVTPGSEDGTSVTQKRLDYISWDDYFMAVAFLSAQRSKDPSSQVSTHLFLETNFNNKSIEITTVWVTAAIALEGSS